MASDRDKLIFLAERVMGWPILHFGDVAFAKVDDEVTVCIWGPSMLPRWNPLENIADAFEVIAAVRKNLANFRRFEIHVVPDAVCAMIATGTGEVDESYPFSAEAATAPRAICDAAIAAYGGMPDGN